MTLWAKNTEGSCFWNIEGNWQGGVNGQNKYQYNGKELNQDFGLDWNDYGARFYDAALARWNVIDPLADTYKNWSPYNYCMNDPIKNFDPNGMEVNIISGGVQFTGADAQAAFSVLIGKTRNVYLSLEEKGIREKTAEAEAKGAYKQMNWAVFAVSDFETGAAAVSAFSDLNNLVLGTHGGNDGNTKQKYLDPNIEDNANGISPTGTYTGNITQYISDKKAGSIDLDKNVGSLEKIMNSVKKGGNIMFAVCFLAFPKDNAGTKMALALGNLTGNIHNLYLNEGFTGTTKGKDGGLLNRSGPSSLNDSNNATWIINRGGNLSKATGAAVTIYPTGQIPVVLPTGKKIN